VAKNLECSLTLLVTNCGIQSVCDCFGCCCLEQVAKQSLRASGTRRNLRPQCSPAAICEDAALRQPYSNEIGRSKKFGCPGLLSPCFPGPAAFVFFNKALIISIGDIMSTQESFPQPLSFKINFLRECAVQEPDLIKHRRKSPPQSDSDSDRQESSPRTESFRRQAQS
jgi:hypothetical protein